MLGKAQIVVYSRSEAGHRSDYIRFVSTLFAVERGGLRDVLFSSSPVFFLMIEESLLLYFAAGLFRSLVGRRTVGLLFRPKPALEGKSLKLRLKRGLLRFLKNIRLVQTLTIVPFGVAPDFATIADGWIYDLQLWDLSESDREVFFRGRQRGQLRLSDDIRSSAEGRAVVSALGYQDRHKGFDVFATVYADSPALRDRFLFAVAGKSAAAVSDLSARFAESGGFSLDRFVTADELLAAYAASDAVWCHYAADYDQASGILGRAVQLGLPVIVRQGSLSHKLCQSEDLPHVAMDGEAPKQSLPATFPASDPEAGLARSKKFRVASLARLETAFGFRD